MHLTSNVWSATVNETAKRASKEEVHVATGLAEDSLPFYPNRHTNFGSRFWSIWWLTWVTSMTKAQISCSRVRYTLNSAPQVANEVSIRDFEEGPTNLLAIRPSTVNSCHLHVKKRLPSSDYVPSICTTYAKEDE